MTVDKTIVRARIHPGIGIARVGNSPTEFFIGPEIPYPMPAPGGGYRDAQGRLRRQAARFRIYGFNAADEVVSELTLDNADILWVVHVANKKAAWYNYELALDIPQAVPCRRRNARVTGAARQGLVIDPGPRQIGGRSRSGVAFDSGMFMGRSVYLGELRTDDAGRLLFLGGHGVSGTPLRTNPATTYANNDGWYDDIADGAVTAAVRIDGQAIPVEHAWVVAGPPNYAPDLITPQTMYDVMDDAFRRAGWLPAEAVSFTRHILPLLRQFNDAQWVNAGFHRLFGWGAEYDFARPDWLAQVSSAAPEHDDARRAVFGLFRRPDYAAADAPAWPQIYGDAAFIGQMTDQPRYLLAITPTQYEWLRAWADGDFTADYHPNALPPQFLDDVPLADQPAALDRAALTFCMGGPFHPGTEMTWPMRQVSMYQSPFRLRIRGSDQPEPDYGAALTSAMLGWENGFVSCVAPGDVTRWMAVPWQTDTASCRSGYEPEYDPFLPTFWPARVPNHVLTAQAYAQVMDPNRALPDRQAAFAGRASWFRGLQGAYRAQINQMVRDFGKMGLVERRDGPTDTPDLPSVVYVETETGFPQAALKKGPPVDWEESIRKEALEDLSGPDVEKSKRPRRLAGEQES